MKFILSLVFLVSSVLSAPFYASPAGLGYSAGAGYWPGIAGAYQTYYGDVAASGYTPYGAGSYHASDLGYGAYGAGIAPIAPIAPVVGAAVAPVAPIAPVVGGLGYEAIAGDTVYGSGAKVDAY